MGPIWEVQQAAGTRVRECPQLLSLSPYLSLIPYISLSPFFLCLLSVSSLPLLSLPISLLLSPLSSCGSGCLCSNCQRELESQATLADPCLSLSFWGETSAQASA